MEVPDNSSYAPPGMDDFMLPPCAVISGLSSRSGLGPQLEKSDMKAEDLLRRFSLDGLQTVIVTDISRDGMLSGPAVELYAGLMEEFPDVRVIASGGVGSMADIEALDRAGVPAVIVGKAIYEGKIRLC